MKYVKKILLQRQASVHLRSFAPDWVSFTMNPFVCGERKVQFKSSDWDKQLLLLSIKEAWTRFKLHTVRLEINFEITSSTAAVREFSPFFHSCPSQLR